MNEIKRYTIVIHADEWEAMRKESLRDLDDFLAGLRVKTLLNHFGNVKTDMTVEMVRVEEQSEKSKDA